MMCIGCFNQARALQRLVVLSILFSALSLISCKGRRPAPRPHAATREPARSKAATAPEPRSAPSPEAATARAQEEPAETPADNEHGFGVVIATLLNVRAKAGTSHRVLDTLRCGDIVDILDKEGVWYSVKVQGLAGFAHSSYVFRVGPGGVRPICRRASASSKHAAKTPTPIRMQAERTKDAPVEKQQSAPDGALPIEEPARTETAGAAQDRRSAAAEAAVSTPKAEDRAPPDRGPASLVFAQESTKVSPSSFSHQMHQSRFACSKCHHPVSAAGAPLSKVADGDANQNKRCRSCHKSREEPRAVRVVLEDAMHRTCRDCHTALGPTRAPSAPRKCAECHRG